MHKQYSVNWLTTIWIHWKKRQKKVFSWLGIQEIQWLLAYKHKNINIFPFSDFFFFFTDKRFAADKKAHFKLRSPFFFVCGLSLHQTVIRRRIRAMKWKTARNHITFELRISKNKNFKYAKITAVQIVHCRRCTQLNTNEKKNNTKKLSAGKEEKKKKYAGEYSYCQL